MYCKYCGSEIEDGSEFCGKCGNPQNTEKRRNKGKKQITVIVIVVLTVIIVGIAFYNHKTGFYIKTFTVEAGSMVDTKMLVVPKDPKAEVRVIGVIDTNKIGKYKLDCVVSNGILKRTKTIVVYVVDTTTPIIQGPDMVTLVLEKDFLPEEYFTVDDFEKGLEKRLVLSPQVDSKKGGKQEIVLSVEDSSGNVGSRTITVNVLRLNKNEEVALQAIEQYIADGNNINDIPLNVWVMKTVGATNGVDYYVEVANNVLYAIYKSGEVSEFTAFNIGGPMIYNLLVEGVRYDGSLVSTARLLAK